MAKPLNTHVGVDIGSSAVKVVELAALGAWRPKKPADPQPTYELVQWAVQPIEAGPYVDQAAKALQALAERYQLARRTVRTAIAGPSVVLRFVDMPKLQPRDLVKAISFEAEQYVPFPLAEVRLDAWMTSELAQNKMRALVVAARHDAIEAHVALLKSANVRCELLDVEPVALVNAFLASPPSALDGAAEAPPNVALIHVGVRNAHVNVLLDGTLSFSRTVPMAGFDLPAELRAAPGHVEAGWDELAQQVTRSLDFVESQCQMRPAVAYLSGGFGHVPQAAKMMEDRLGLPVRVWNPLSRCHLTPEARSAELEALAPQLAIAVGLAARP